MRARSSAIVARAEFPQMFVCGTGIERIGGMGQNPGNVVFSRKGKISLHIRGNNGFGISSPGIAGEKLKGIGIYFYSVLSHSKIALGGGQVTSNSKHMISFQKRIENMGVLNSYYTLDQLKSKGRLFL